MQKLCTQCLTTQPLSLFVRRAASPDGYGPVCKACKRLRNRADYALRPEVAEKQKERTVQNKRERFKRDPAYKKAFNLWGSTKKRATKIPPWVSITDFVPICQKLLNCGPGWVLDHVLPLNGKDVCGLHVPTNMQVLPEELNRLKHNRS